MLHWHLYFNVLYLQLNVLYLHFNVLYLHFNVLYLQLNVLYLQLNVLYLHFNVLYLQFNVSNSSKYLWYSRLVWSQNLLHLEQEFKTWTASNLSYGFMIWYFFEEVGFLS